MTRGAVADANLFSLFGARYLGSDPAERNELFAKLANIYDSRSKSVHGAGLPTRERVEVTVRDARELTFRVLTKALESGWPSPGHLKDAVVEG